MDFRLFLGVVFFFGISSDVLAQKDTSDLYSGGRIKSYRDHLNVRLNANSRVDGFSVETNPRSIEILPNTEVRTELSVSYRFISFSAGTSPKFFSSNRDNKLKGETRSKRFNVNLNLDHLMQQIAYTRTKGYYLGNTSDYLTNWNKDSPYVQFPDLYYNGLYGSTGWKWNRDFSFNAITTQTEEQLCSTGTFLPSLTYHFYVLDDKTPLTATNSTQRSSNFELLLNTGYYYTWVIGSGFYAILGASSGAGIISTRLTTRWINSAFVTRNHHFIWRTEAISAMGYSSERFFCGTQFFFNAQQYAQSRQSNITRYSMLSWQIFAGLHLHAPKKLRRLIDSLEEKKDKIIGSVR